MIKIVIESQYLPRIDYFALLMRADSVTIDTFEFYERQTYRNRCEILGANGVMSLSVPVIGGRKKVLTKDIKIDNDQPWRKIHWRSIQSAYGKAPFFEYYADGFEQIYQKGHDYLIDMNHDFMSLCLKYLGLEVHLSYSERFVNSQEIGYQNFRSLISPKNTQKSVPGLTEVAYQQVFGSNFVPSLSLIDLLLCEGPNAGSILRKITMPGS